MLHRYISRPFNLFARSCALLLLAVVTLGLASTAAWAQDALRSPRQTVESPQPRSFGNFGTAVVAVDDVDGDGTTDLAVGAPGESAAGSPFGAGRIHIVSGADGTALDVVTSPSPAAEAPFGSALASMPDVNGDGTADLLVGDPTADDGATASAGQVYILSGADRSRIRTFTSPNAVSFGRFGSAVDAVADANGDGTPDVLVGTSAEPANGLDGAGRAYLLSGADGSVLQAFASPNAAEFGAFGETVTGLGDVDGDGTPDVAVSSREAVSGARSAGRVYVLSGSNGQAIHTITSPNLEEFAAFGAALDGLPDVNGDGTDDLLVGAPDEDTDSASDTGDDQGRVYVVDGATGSIVFSRVSPTFTETVGGFGTAVSSVPDVDDDGVADLLVGAANETVDGTSGAGRVHVLSGRTGGTIRSLASPNTAEFGGFGTAVAGVPSLSGPSAPDLLVGAPFESVGDSTDAGRAYVYGSEALNRIAPPSDLTASAGDAAITLNWAPPSRDSLLARYRIYRSTAPITGTPDGRTPVDSVSAGTTTYTDAVSDAGETFFYRVTAVDTEGTESGFSNEASASPGGGTDATVVFVDASVSPSGDGSSWANAYTHLQDALDQANAATGGAFEIRVAEGVYRPTVDSDGDHTTDPTEAFTIERDSIQVVGGYPNGGGTRDPAAHRTVLSGDIDGDDTTTPDGVTAAVADIAGTNTAHVVTVSGGFGSQHPATGLRGVTITGGQANGPQTSDTNGGGVNILNASPTFRETIIVGNQAQSSGGGVYVEGGLPAFADVTIRANDAFSGGGMFVIGNLGSANPTLVNVTFAGNQAGDGGGLVSSGNLGSSLPILHNAVFSGNRADGRSGDNVAAQGHGGAVLASGVNDGATAPVFFGATFAGNAAVGNGGAVFNTSSGTGQVGTALVNSIAWGNRSDTDDSDARPTGDQVYNQGGNTDVVVNHVMLEGGLGAVVNDLDASTIESGPVLDQDPQFADAEGPDGTPGTPDDDLRLQGPGSAGGASPAIDAGVGSGVPADTLDLDGDGDRFERLPVDRSGAPRIQDVSSVSGSGVDLGAYESDGAALPVELATFTATRDADAVVLSWRTASETNNAGFRVQHRSPEATAWSTRSFVEGAGTTAEPQDYRFRVSDLGAGTHRFRLQQVDTDGSTSLSSVQTITVAPQSLSLRAPYPNPAQEQATVAYTLPRDQHVTLRVFNVLGQRVATLVEERATAGRKTLTVDTGSLSSGMYFVRLVAGGTTRVQRLVVAR